MSSKERVKAGNLVKCTDCKGRNGENTWELRDGIYMLANFTAWLFLLYVDILF